MTAYSNVTPATGDSGKQGKPAVRRKRQTLMHGLIGCDDTRVQLFTAYAYVFPSQAINLPTMLTLARVAAIPVLVAGAIALAR